MFLEQYDLFWPFFNIFKELTGVRLFFGPRNLIWNKDILSDDPQIFFGQNFLKNKFSRVVSFIYANFDVFTNKTVEWPKFALLYNSFLYSDDRC